MLVFKNLILICVGSTNCEIFENFSILCIMTSIFIFSFHSGSSVQTPTLNVLKKREEAIMEYTMRRLYMYNVHTVETIKEF